VVNAVETENDLEQQIDEMRQQIDEAARQLADLQTKKYAMGTGSKKAMLGILLGEHSNQDGVELVGVTPGGGAKQAGLQAGDLIVQLNDLSLTETDNPMRALSKYMKDVAPGDELIVVYERDDQRQTTTITTQARSAHMLQLITENLENLDLDFDLNLDLDLDLEKLIGLSDMEKQVWVHKDETSKRLMAVSGDLAAYFDVKEGVIVLEPPTGSELKAGDVLLTVAGEDIADLESATEVLGNIDEQTQVTVKRRGKRHTINVKADEFADASPVSQTRIVRIENSSDGHDHVQVKVKIIDD
jgi:S1-C subfamily serine protease